MSATAERPLEGVIRPDCLYTLDAVKTLAGLGKHALRSARRAGLPVRLQGRKGFVLGADLIRHITENGKVNAAN